jgi:hypothetical protein
MEESKISDLDMEKYGGEKLSSEKVMLEGNTRVAIIGLEFKTNSEAKKDKNQEEYVSCWGVLSMSYEDGEKVLKENLSGIRLYKERQYTGEGTVFGEFKAKLREVCSFEDTFEGVKKAVVGKKAVAGPVILKVGGKEIKKNLVSEFVKDVEELVEE